MKPNKQSQPSIESIAFQYRIEHSWQYNSTDFLGLPYLGANSNVYLGSIYVPLTFHPLRGDVQERTPLGSILKAHQHLVFLGGPGSGKSMLSQVITYAFSKEGGEPWTRKLGVNRMPILMTLRDYKTHNWHTIDNMLEDYIDQLSINSKKDITPAWLKQCLETGQALLIWDGIDEVGGAQTRKQLRTFFTEQIVEKGYLDQQGQEAEERNIIIMTSRISGYSEASFDELGLEPYVVNGFNELDINRYINNWFNARESKPSLMNPIKKVILTAVNTDDNLKSLAETPFLLSMILAVARISNGLLNGLAIDKVDLFDKIFDAYLVDIHHTKGFKVFHRPKEMKRWLAELAWEISNKTNETSNEGIFYISKTDALKIPAETTFNISEFLDYVSKQSGILIEVGHEQYCFAHPSFQEYLAAWKLRGLITDFDSLLDTCTHLMLNVQYHEILVMLFSLLEEFGINDDIFDKLHEEQNASNEAVTTLFFARLLVNEDVGLSYAKEKLIAEQTLEMCNRTQEKTVIVFLSKLSNKRSELLLVPWFDRHLTKVDLFDSKFFITAFSLYPDQDLWLSKVINRIEGQLPSEILDKTTLDYIRTSLNSLRFQQDAMNISSPLIRYTVPIVLAGMLSLAPPSKLISQKITINHDYLDRIKQIALVFAERYSIKTQVELSGAQQSFVVNGDPTALMCVILNLIDNAIKYSHKSSNEKNKVIIRLLEIFPKKIGIQIENEGFGVKLSEKEKIFFLGYHSENTLGHNIIGIQTSTIDLYRSRLLMRELGGDLILVNASDPTVFEIQLQQ